MSRSKKVLAAVVGVLTVSVLFCFVFPKLYFPSGVWRRRVVRDDPLPAAISVAKVSIDALVLSDGRRCRLAGVSFPRDQEVREEAVGFLQVVTQQGVEIARRVNDEDAYILRCEPRIWHWCGNDPVRAHFEQHNLNELVVASGYARFDASTEGLGELEARRLRACEACAQVPRWVGGRWKRDHRVRFSTEFGLNYSDVYNLKEMVETYVDVEARDDEGR